MSGVGGTQDSGTGSTLAVSEAVVHVVRRVQTERRVMVLGVVPGEELGAELASVLDAAEAYGERGPVLQRLELCLGEGVVVGGVRPRTAADSLDT